MLKRRIGALLLAVSLAFSGLVIPAKAEEQAESDVIVHYDMSHEGEYLKDVSGHNNNAKLYHISDGDFKDVYGDAVLKFPGTNESYAELPVSIKEGLNYKEAFTIEMTLMPNTAQFQFLWTIGTGYQTDYLFFNPRLANGNMNVAIKTAAVNQENAIPGVGNVQLSTQKYSLVTVTSEGNTLKLYVNGQAIGTLNHSHNLDDIFGGNDKGVLGYLAKSNWNDPYCDAEVTDFKIYNRPLSESDVKKNYTEMEALETLKADADKVSLPEYTFEDLTLPVKGASGSAITWKSSAPEVISADGKIQAGATGTTRVTLTATFEDGTSGVAVDKAFQVDVVANGDQGKLEFIAEQFDLGISYVTEDITLVNEFKGVAVEWTGNELITKDGKVTRPDKDTEVSLNAKFSYKGYTAEKSYSVTVAAKTAGYLASYVADYEYNMGAEFAEFPAHKYSGIGVERPQYDYTQYSDNVRTDVMFYGISKDGKTYEALNSDKAVLYSKGKLQMGSPALFRKADGTYGAIASVNNEQPQIMIWDSEDLIFFENQRTVALNDQNIAVKNPTVKYDNASGKYEVYWEGGNGKSYVSRSTELKTFEAAEETTYKKEAVKGTFPIYACEEEASVLELTAEEMDRIQKKYGEIYSVDVETEDIQVEPGEAVTLSDTVDVVYNDGSKKAMGVTWDTEKSGLDLDNPKEGAYTITGTVEQETYASPLAECRADPYVVYNEQDGMYYFTSSYMQADLQNAYSRLIIRRADSISGLTDAEEVTVWDGSKDVAKPWYWAPEIHYIGGYWRIIALSTVNGSWRMTIFTCTGGDMMDPDDWEYTGVVKNAPNGLALGAFDTTFFEYDGVCYYISPASSNIYITTFDPSDPLTPTSDLVAISTPTYSWEYNIATKQDIEEGSAVMIHDGKIYLTYAASTVDMNYAVGLLYADLDDDLTDPASWTKYPYPVLSTPDLTTTVTDPDFANEKEGTYSGTFGPGHNSLTIDKNGNPVIVYHARDWADDFTNGEGKYGLRDPGRHAYAANIHFGADGFPIFNMTSEQELSDDLKTVTMTVTVKEKEEPTLPFVDVKEDDWHYNAVYYNYVAGTMTGLNDTHFGPNQSLARAQFATILYRMNGTPKVEYKATFPDVQDGIWYTDAILWAADTKVVTGYTDTGKFGPADNINREQMAVMMYRYAKFKDYTIDNQESYDKFEDADKVSAFAKEAMEWAYGNGIIKGKYNETKIDPQGSATRAECATIIMRFMEKFEK